MDDLVAEAQPVEKLRCECFLFHEPTRDREGEQESCSLSDSRLLSDEGSGYDPAVEKRQVGEADPPCVGLGPSRVTFFFAVKAH